MVRQLILIAVVGTAAAAGIPAARAQSVPAYSYGVFRENITNVSDAQKNCWVQATVDGSSINGERIAERLTEPQAEAALQHAVHRGLCAGQRTSPTWSTRADDRHDGGWTGSKWSGSN